MYTVPHEEKHIQPVRATTSSSVRSGKHIFCSNGVWLKLKALWAAAKLYSELTFADTLSHPDWGRNWTKMWMSIVHLKAIPVFTVELLILELEKHLLFPVCCFTPPPAATLFSCSEPLFWAACALAARTEVWGDPLVTCCLLHHETDNLGESASCPVQQKCNLWNLVKWFHYIYVHTYVYV